MIVNGQPIDRVSPVFGVPEQNWIVGAQICALTKPFPGIGLRLPSNGLLVQFQFAEPTLFDVIHVTFDLGLRFQQFTQA